MNGTQTACAMESNHRVYRGEQVMPSTLNQVSERQSLPDVGNRLREAIESTLALRDRLSAVVDVLGVPLYDAPAVNAALPRPVNGLVDDFHDKLDRLVQLQGECHALTEAVCRA